MENYSLTCPLGENRIAFYAKENYSLAYRSIGERKIAAAKDCFEDGARLTEARIEKGMLRVDVKACVPCIVELVPTVQRREI